MSRRRRPIRPGHLMTAKINSLFYSRKWKWALLAIAMVTTLITGALYEVDRNGHLIRMYPNYLPVDHINREMEIDKGGNLMIVSYMRSGSSMNGKLFGENAENFYVFEPLIRLAPHHYLTENQFCEMKELKCRADIVENTTQANERMIPAGKSKDKVADVIDVNNHTTKTMAAPIDKRSIRNLIEKVIRNLKNIYNCNIRNLDDGILRTIMFEHSGKSSKSGESWTNFTRCYVKLVEPNVTDMARYLETARTTEFEKHRDILRLLKQSGHKADIFRNCLNQLEANCRTCKLRVTKVLRLSLRFLPLLLKEVPDLKVLFIIRDPRGIINSRIQTNWYPIAEDDIASVKDNIESLCFKMKEDIKMIEQLKANFPGRFLDLSLEEIAKEPVKGYEAIFSLSGLKLTQTYLKQIKTLFEEKPTFLSRWTSTLNPKYVTFTEENCSDVFIRYGYERVMS